MTTGGRIMGTCFGWSVGWSVGWSLGIPDDDRPNADTDARVKFAGEKRTVIDGPFAETKELVAGFWLWKCASLPEAIEWVKRCPNPMPGEEAEIEIRQVFEPEDFSPASNPELRKEGAEKPA